MLRHSYRKGSGKGDTHAMAFWAGRRRSVRAGGEGEGGRCSAHPPTQWADVRGDARASSLIAHPLVRIGEASIRSKAFALENKMSCNAWRGHTWMLLSVLKTGGIDLAAQST